MYNEKTKPNRLAGEKSPYLLQHADNPVDWYPWGEAAFDKARTEDKPIFLSIGYSTCHWCHVMAHESFEDKQVAELLNQNFVSVKVDREERPDIDSVYMTVCQAFTGSGGWPLTIIMTPEKKPFFAGTYFPKREKHGHVGLIELLTFVQENWQKKRDLLLEESEKITSFVAANQQNQGRDSKKSPATLMDEATAYFAKSFDSKWGGFGPMPKFPSPHNLLFLLSRKESQCLFMAEKTLVQMYRGGIFDHIGGGFCRYSTDDRWLVPHFEKMLYDNALLLMAYAEGFEKTGNNLYKQIAERITTYVVEELTQEQGGFLCSQDADSDGVEGKYYVFSPGEIKEVLGQEKGEHFCSHYNITAAGNFEGKSIPNRLEDADYKEFAEPEVLEKLSQFRKKRTSLHKDDKILSGWNGLMIAALARAARKLDRPDYFDMAMRAEAFIWKHLCDENGKLQARWRLGEAAYPGTLEDYAFFAWALLECYASSFDAEYLKKAVAVGEQMLEQFFDEEEGGCFLYGKDSEQLFVRPKEFYDGAMPSGNSVAALVMKRLAFYTGSSKWRQAWEQQQGFLSSAVRHPAGHSFFMWVLSETYPDRGQLICVARDNLPIKELHKLDMEILVKTCDNQEEIERINPALKEYAFPKKEVDYYFCQNFRCNAPVDSIEKVKKLTERN